MAVAALELYIWPIRAAADRFHMNRVIELDGAGIACRYTGDGEQRGEFRVAALETTNVSGLRSKQDTVASGLQVGMALGTSMFAHGGNMDGATVFRVAGAARELFRSAGMMHRPVVAVEAGGVSGFC